MALEVMGNCADAAACADADAAADDARDAASRDAVDAAKVGVERG